MIQMKFRIFAIEFYFLNPYVIPQSKICDQRFGFPGKGK